MHRWRSCSEFANERNDLFNITNARSCQARLAILQGDPAFGERWLQTADLDSDVGIMLYWLEVPRMTQCRVLIAQESEADLQAGLENLNGFWQEDQRIHDTRQMIDVAALQAFGTVKQGRRDEAMYQLTLAVALAEPGGWIQPFVELGPDLAGLLRGVAQQGVAPAFIARILAAFPEPRSNLSPMSAAQLPASLTNREFQVLELLAQRYRDKEVAAQMSISTPTVKRHASNIYHKLQVSGRRSAVQKDIELGLLPPA